MNSVQSTTSLEGPSVVAPGRFVILRDGTGERRLVRVPVATPNHPRGEKVRFIKQHIPAAVLWTAQPGLTYRFEAATNAWQPLNNNDESSDQLFRDVEAASSLSDDDAYNESQGDIQFVSSDTGEDRLHTGAESDEASEVGTSHTESSAQELSESQIHQLKSSGVSGIDVVKQLVAHSSTFLSKSKFAQAKYIRKKMNRHVAQFTLYPVTLFDICETYYNWDFHRVGGLRWDYLASLLGYAGVETAKRILLFDNSSSGLVLAALLQKTAGRALIFRASGVTGISDKLVREMNIPLESQNECVVDIPLSLLQLALETVARPDDIHELTHPVNAHPWIKPPSDLRSRPIPRRVKQAHRTTQGDSTALEPASHNHPQESHATPPQSTAPTGSDVASGPNPPATEETFTSSPAAPDPQQYEYLQKQRRKAVLLKHLVEYGVDCIVVATSQALARAAGDDGVAGAPTFLRVALDAAVNYVKPNGKFAMFTLNMAAANEAYKHLSRQNLHFTNTRMEELFLRYYQVLPNRTHPIMSPSIRLLSGLLLSSIRIA